MSQCIYTKKSTTNGAAIDPTWAIVDEVPNAELLKFVGNSSAVCSVTTEYTAVMPNLANIASETIHTLASNTKIFSWFFFVDFVNLICVTLRNSQQRQQT